jgi:hypothetical protein
MRILQLLFLSLFIAIFAGCATKPPDHVELLESGPGEFSLAICKQQWGGLFGPEGFVGYQTWTYWAILKGEGPIFVNPKFTDMPSDYQCIGTITLDKAHNVVIVKMSRIVSSPGSPLQTKPHPANGTYKIDVIGKYHE